MDLFKFTSCLGEHPTHMWTPLALTLPPRPHTRGNPSGPVQTCSFGIPRIKLVHYVAQISIRQRVVDILLKGLLVKEAVV